MYLRPYLPVLTIPPIAIFGPFLKQIIHASTVQITLELSLFWFSWFDWKLSFFKYYKNHRIRLSLCDNIGLAAVLFF